MKHSFSPAAIVLTCAFAIFSGAAAQSAQAAQYEPPRTTVAFGDLNLKASEGVEKLYVRLRSAARQVCARTKGVDLASRARYERCTAAAISAAVADISAPAVTAHHEQQTGRTSFVSMASR